MHTNTHPLMHMHVYIFMITMHSIRDIMNTPIQHYTYIQYTHTQYEARYIHVLM